MFEKIVERILNPILSEYVEDFNSENMKIGLWSGEVVIKNVKLRKEIIQKLNLPLKIKYSRLGCLKMSIPWKSLGSSKIDIVIDGL
jgi:vacuolar protein sorting-associated protein 13A/C